MELRPPTRTSNWCSQAQSDAALKYQQVGWRIRWGCAILTLNVLLAACGSSTPAALAANPAKWVWGTPIVPVGAREYFGFTDLKAAGQDPVHITGAAVQGVPDGLTIVGIHAVSMRETDAQGTKGHYIADLGEAELKRDYPNLRLHPVTDAVAMPGVPLDWYLVVEAMPTKPGRFRTGGIRIDYRAGDETGSQVFTGWILDIRCGDQSPSPSSASG